MGNVTVYPCQTFAVEAPHTKFAVVFGLMVSLRIVRLIGVVTGASTVIRVRVQTSGSMSYTTP